jgi:hypothetical protein
VKDHFNSKGKKLTHCTVLYNVRMFEEVRRRKPHLNDVRDAIMGKIDPKYLLMKMIENIEDISKIEQITNCVNYNE